MQNKSWQNKRSAHKIFVAYGKDVTILVAGTKTFALKIATAVKLLRKVTLSENKTITVIKINVYASSIYSFSIRICLTRCLEFY